MASTGYDVEKAIRTIAVLLRNIVVVKGKFLVVPRNLYGLFILIADVKRQSLFRIRVVVSYNPALHETSLENDWYDFEKWIYGFRLWEGTLQQVTQDLERILTERMGQENPSEFYGILRSGEEKALTEHFQGILGAHFSGSEPQVTLFREDLNLDQFRRFKAPPEEDRSSRSTGLLDGPSAEGLVLSINLLQAPQGSPARDIQAGDSVQALLTDNRDIAHYLSQLIGGRDQKGAKPLTVPVEGVRLEGDSLHIHVRLSTGIVGVAQVPGEMLLFVQKRSQPRWWNKFFTR
jgi:hypothetical protein